MNVTIVFEERPVAVEQVLKHNATFKDGREFDVIKRLESLTVRCGPYDNSDVIMIERDKETGEIRVLVPGGDDGLECVYSVMEEEV